MKAFVGICAALACAACANLAPGDGTVERDGECVPADVSVTPASCGTGTLFSDQEAKCVSILPPTICDPVSTVEEVDEDGVVVCLGTVQEGCTGPLPCPTPDPGKMSICGQLLDLETGATLEVDGIVNARCDVANPSADGPCSMAIEFYDAIDFVNDPTNAPALPAEELIIDACGRFSAYNVPVPMLGFVGIGIDDAGSGDVHELSGVAMEAASGESLRDTNAYVVRRSTVQSWTSTADDPFGAATFGDVGVYVPIFIHEGERVPGVRVTRGGSAFPNDTYYFSDPDDTILTVDLAQDSTGANGAGLLVNSPSIGLHSGTDSEPAGCVWPDNQAATIAGVVFVQERVAECD
jgi:hypothetical protein